jgi:hypothetical protein
MYSSANQQHRFGTQGIRWPGLAWHFTTSAWPGPGQGLCRALPRSPTFRFSDTETKLLWARPIAYPYINIQGDRTHTKSTQKARRFLMHGSAWSGNELLRTLSHRISDMRNPKSRSLSPSTRAHVWLTYPGQRGWEVLVHGMGVRVAILVVSVERSGGRGGGLTVTVVANGDGGWRRWRTGLL